MATNYVTKEYLSTQFDNYSTFIKTKFGGKVLPNPNNSLFVYKLDVFDVDGTLLFTTPNLLGGGGTGPDLEYVLGQDENGIFMQKVEKPETTSDVIVENTTPSPYLLDVSGVPQLMYFSNTTDGTELKENKYSFEIL